MDNKEKRDFILKLIIATSSVLTFIVILVAGVAGFVYGNIKVRKKGSIK